MNTPKDETKQFDFPQGEQICADTLHALEYAREGVLMRQGVAPDTARLFALLEFVERNALALKIGAEAALLARLVWYDVGEGLFGCTLVPDELGHDFTKDFFFGFSATSWPAKFSLKLQRTFRASEEHEALDDGDLDLDLDDFDFDLDLDS